MKPHQAFMSGFRQSFVDAKRFVRLLFGSPPKHQKAPFPGGDKQGRYYDELPHADEVEQKTSSRPTSTPLGVWVTNAIIVLVIVFIVALLAPYLPG